MHRTEPRIGTVAVTMWAATQAGSISRNPPTGFAANSPNTCLIFTCGSTASPWRKYGVSPGPRIWTSAPGGRARRIPAARRSLATPAAGSIRR